MHLCYIADASNVHPQRWAAFFVERGHRVSVITDLAGTVPGASVYNIGECLPRLSLPVFSAVYQIIAKTLAIRRLIGHIRPDIVHGHYATNYGFLAALSGFTPLVQTVHGSDVLVDAAGSWEQRWFVRYALRKATLITSVAEHMIRKVRSMGISPECILTFQYGVDTSVFAPPADTTVRNPLRVVSTRMFEWKYNVEQLIRAVPGVQARIPDAEVVLAGDGPDRAALARLIQGLHIERMVTMAGRVAPDVIPALLQSATVYVSTSVTDGSSLSLIEAMACGAFPVVTDIPANQEWIVDGENGFLVPVGDADALADRIVWAFEHPAAREAMVARNLDLIRRRGDYRTNMTMMEGVYERLLRER
ncbi:MAG: glycosyltransferase family 4 protein [Candidatus Latescibacteria bacterium]|nr:glycosyltransferase family 4 protein [Candidatus Latescibacterota bacterium]